MGIKGWEHLEKHVENIIENMLGEQTENIMRTSKSKKN
jgi:hypothetical protein